MSTDKLAKNVRLTLEGADGFFTDNYFDLIPGEYKAFELKTKSQIDDLKNKISIMSLVDSY